MLTICLGILTITKYRARMKNFDFTAIEKIENIFKRKIITEKRYDVLDEIKILKETIELYQNSFSELKKEIAKMALYNTRAFYVINILTTLRTFSSRKNMKIIKEFDKAETLAEIRVVFERHSANHL